jgi:hypothetical protein
MLTGVVGLLALLSLSPVGAASANISHSYHASGSIANGSIVSLDPNRADYVQSANVTNGSRLSGVAVASNDSLLAVDAATGMTQVATSGTVTTLVSNLNGTIAVGDQIAVSPVNGVGMKALPGSYVIGLAQTAFDGSNSGAQTEQITDKSGKAVQVRVGDISLSLAVGRDNAAADGVQLNSLQKLAQNLTGRTVSTVRVVVSLVVAFVALLSLVTLIYASIYGSIISIGRNPLAKYAVFRTLRSVLGMAVLTAVIASLTIFFLLR